MWSRFLCKIFSRKLVLVKTNSLSFFNKTPPDVAGSSLRNTSTKPQINFPGSYEKECIIPRGLLHFPRIKFEWNMWVMTPNTWYAINMWHTNIKWSLKRHPRLWDLWKVFVFRVLLVHFFTDSDWIRRATEYLSVFSPNAGKNGPLHRILTLFTQWSKNTIYSSILVFYMTYV